jgi:hypothetical protein
MKTILAAFLGLALLGAGAPAHSECKGLKKDACTKTDGCQWVKGHKRGKGGVAGYCRKKPKKGK